MLGTEDAGDGMSWGQRMLKTEDAGDTRCWGQRILGKEDASMEDAGNSER